MKDGLRLRVKGQNWSNYVCPQALTLPWIDGFKNNIAQMITLVRQSGTQKKHMF